LDVSTQIQGTTLLDTDSEKKGRKERNEEGRQKGRKAGEMDEWLGGG
jgi:hypothetical protein